MARWRLSTSSRRHPLVGDGLPGREWNTAAHQRGEVAIGYRGAGHNTDKARAYGVVVNPNKAEPVTFGPEDMIIVIAEG